MNTSNFCIGFSFSQRRITIRYYMTLISVTTFLGISTFVQCLAKIERDPRNDICMKNNLD